MRYEFKYVSIKDKVFPILPLIVKKENEIVPVDMLVDSGAFISLFHGDVGRALGIKIEEGEKLYPMGLSGNVLAYVHKVKILIGGKEIETNVGFSDELAVNINMLGREGIFDKFDI